MLGVELVLGIHALWRYLPQTAASRWGEVWNSEMHRWNSKAMSLSLFSLWWFAAGITNDISHLMSDTTVIKTWTLMVFAIPFLVQSLAAAKTSLLDSAHPFHSWTSISWPTTVFAFGARDPNLFFCPSSSKTQVCSVSKVGQNLVYSHRQEL